MIYIFGGAFDPPHVGHTAIIQTLLAKKQGEKIIIIPSSERDDKKYNVSDAARLEMLDIFVREIDDERVIVDDYFIQNWKGEMITRDVDEYAKSKYGEDIVHIFGTDTIESMPDWDSEGYAAKVVKKLFVPRGLISLPQNGEQERTSKNGILQKLTEGDWCRFSPGKGGVRGGFREYKSTLTHHAKENRKNMNMMEKKMWYLLKGEGLGYKFHRQKPIGNYILDFYSPSLQLSIEIDGESHIENLGYDTARTDSLNSLGIHVLRYTNQEIMTNIEGVRDDILKWILSITNPSQPPLFRGGVEQNPSQPPLFRGGVEQNPSQPPLFRGGVELNPSQPPLFRGGVEQNPSQPPLFRGGEDTSSDTLPEFRKGIQEIDNFELFTDCHIPDISSTELRKIIPEYTGLEILYSHNPKFIIPGLSKKISQYILEHRLYRNPPPEKGEQEGVSSLKTEQTHPNPPLSGRGSKPKVLVHVCCGPDVTMPILALKDEYELICFWYDPNIQPKEEYDKRYDAFVKVCEIEGIPYIKGAYDVKHFFTRIKGLEFTPEKGEKCTNCYDMRMYVAAKLAKKLKIPYYTSSLNTSPKKDLEKLFLIGEEYGKKFGVEFLAIPFRKRGGFEKSVEYTHKHDIFRQNYCGCIYSIPEGGESEMKGRMVG